jgi:calcium-dependent protein kinase
MHQMYHQLIQPEFQEVKNIQKLFSFSKKLGSGNFGKVYRVVRKLDGRKLALKVVKLKHGDDKGEQREISIMAQLHHENIAEFVHAYKQKINERIIVMELCTGGELFSAIVKKGKLTEGNARQIMYELLSALQYCHERRIAHLDVKPENIMLSEPVKLGFNRFPPIKLVDFGLSYRFERFKEPLPIRGTPEYLAPEVWKADKKTLNTYNEKADLWAAGCIMFVMIAGTYPFLNRAVFKGRQMKGNMALMVNTRSVNPSYEYIPIISPSGMTFLEKLFVKDKDKRISAAKSLVDPWFTDNRITTTSYKSVAIRLRHYAAKNKLKRTIIHDIVAEMPDSQKSDVAMIFKGHQEMTLAETKDCILKYLDDKDMPGLTEMIQKLDLNADDVIDTNEFLCAMIAPRYMTRETYNRFFLELKAFTGEGISLELLKTVFVDEAQAEKVFADLDKNEDGTISSEEFVDWCIQDLG